MFFWPVQKPVVIYLEPEWTETALSIGPQRDIPGDLRLKPVELLWWGPPFLAAFFGPRRLGHGALRLGESHWCSVHVPTLVNYITVLLGECSTCCNWNQSLTCKRYICTIVLLSEIIYLYYSIIIILIYLYFNITFKWLTHIIVLLTNDISIF